VDWAKHSRRVFILLILGGVCSLHQGSARTPSVERALQTVLSNYEVVRMEPGDIQARVRTSNRLKVQLRSGLLDFRIEPRNLLSPRYRAEVTGEDGVRRQLPPPLVTTYKGTAVVGQEVVQARFTITSDKFEGVVFTPGDWHYVEPLGNFLPSADRAELVVFRHSDIKPGQEWRCGVSRRLQEGRDRLEARAASTDTTTTYTVEVATEADYEYVQYWGSASAANQEIQGILNQVEGVYETELKLKLEIVYQHAWTRSSDPYSGTDGGILLDQFREHWNANFYAEGYDLAHLWTGRETLTSKDEEGEERDIGGTAWLGTVCRPSQDGSYSYGISKGYTQTPYKFSITAHEIGHNFDATHPDEEDPPVVNCARTIMQGKVRPTDLLSFCPFSRSQIRDHVSTYNSCLEATTETITLNPPANLAATALGPHRIRLTWRDTNGEIAHGWRIERKSPGNSWDLLVWLWRGQREFIDGSVEPERSYSFRMRAYPSSSVNAESSAWSRTATVTTPAKVEVPGPLSLTRWVIPTMANSPGRGGTYYRTKVILNTFDDDLDLVVSLYGPNGFVSRGTYLMKANRYRTWTNFLSDFFDYQGAGAVEFSGNAPFMVSAEVYTTSSHGKYTTVVHNGPAPLTPYSSRAASVGVVTVDDSIRTNAGAFNNSNQSQTVTAYLYYPDTDSDDPDQTITFSLPPKGWAQKSVSARGERGYIFWRIPQEAYLWVVSVDNLSNDGTLSFPTPWP